MNGEIPLTLQTAYAELLDRTASAAFNDEFQEDGVFVPKTIRGRRYWYFQTSTEAGRKQRYVGPETSELLDRIKRHKEVRDDLKERQTLVSTLLRSAYLPRPIPKIGDIVAKLAAAGVFRLHGVLIGTVAYQTYSAMLGVRLPAASLQTADVDIAQFKNVSIVVEEQLPPILGVLKQVDKSFRDVPYALDSRRTVSYVASGGIRVDFLTPLVDAESDEPERLSVLGTDAQQLKFLDFLIRDPEPAVLLHGAGIYVRVPAPQRFAVHKLIVAQRRQLGTGKRDKDLIQAAALLEFVAQKRPQDIANAWHEAFGRGKKWRRALTESLAALDAKVRDLVLKVADLCRDIIPDLDLTFASTAPRYDIDRDVVVFIGKAGTASVECAISREALEDHFDANNLDAEGRVAKFRERREFIQQLARIKYLKWPVEESGRVLIKSADVSALAKQMPRTQN